MGLAQTRGGQIMRGSKQFFFYMSPNLKGDLCKRKFLLFKPANRFKKWLPHLIYHWTVKALKLASRSWASFVVSLVSLLTWEFNTTKSSPIPIICFWNQTPLISPRTHNETEKFLLFSTQELNNVDETFSSWKFAFKQKLQHYVRKGFF